MAVREAMKPEIENVNQQLVNIDNKLSTVEKTLSQRIGDLDQRVSRLEGSILMGLCGPMKQAWVACLPNSKQKCFNAC